MKEKGKDRMKKIILIAAAAMLSMLGGREAAGKSISIEESFSDNNFAMYIRDTYDTNKDGKLSDEETKAVKKINVGEDSYYKLDEGGETITSLKGIEVFPNLEKLDCSGNSIKKLNLKKNNKLKYLDCIGNKIKKLDISKNKDLKILYAGNNKLTKIDVSLNNKIKLLDISENKIKKINVQNLNNLRELYCYKTLIKNLDLKNNAKLDILDCSASGIRKLNLKPVKKLNFLNCENNKMKKLDLRKNKNVEYLHCRGNSLISGSLHIPFSKLNETSKFSKQGRVIKVKKIGNNYYVPIKGLDKTKGVTKLSTGKITDKGIQLKGTKIPKKITYYYNMFQTVDKIQGKMPWIFLVIMQKSVDFSALF